MLVFILNLCVIGCQFIFPNEIDVQLQKEYGGKFTQLRDKVEYAPPEWMNKTCHFCYDKWKHVYVENASLYTSFYLFTRETGDNYTTMYLNDTQSIIEAGFSTEKNTKIIIHGWFNSGSSRFAETMERAYLAAEDVNVISVNWATLAFHFYTLAATAVQPVGMYSAKLVDVLVNELNVSPSTIHVMGHSLGAHVAGNIGKSVTFGNLPRITGLDPAGPLFTSDSHQRLNSSDAEFVDVIHSTVGILGYTKPMGTVDFYPNGGLPNQPGCFANVICAHRRSYLYFAESISSNGFIGTACGSWKKYKQGKCVDNRRNIMGMSTNLGINGTYYLHTRSSSPYAAGNHSLLAGLNIEE